ncbi:hypothetical protein THASP1DRAFT_28334 [Thamnocephalis sphaerospora]|uniref:Uncharacterized protein n=1 Tax=Thamnocephalis sphaerospora TaxID=78915 RepID=A0A4P9XUH1_9FUNG|nr:hypothetical protein THASP1DRAFT_28334 [Thamnocephalis sphaerospora]|eukprot:RKP09875.1 hypothetical protein THASP1DRAFT_28334 [Thamnocephalis sphaerospora]
MAATVLHARHKQTVTPTDDMHGILSRHCDTAYRQAAEFAEKSRSLRHAIEQSAAGQDRRSRELIDSFLRSSLELQEQVQQHARHVEEEATMLEARISDDIVQELDDVQLAERRLNEAIASAFKKLDASVNELQAHIGRVNTKSTLADDVELGQQNWHLGSQSGMAGTGKSSQPSFTGAMGR